MFDDTSFPKKILANPTKLALSMITAMEGSLDGDLSIPDVNNGFVIQAGAAVGIFAGICQKLDYNYAYAYPQRARTAAQLYPHLSQFDYTNITASPASATFTFVMDKAWMVANAVPYDDNYNVIVIPKTTQFFVGTLTFGMHYPIIIYINKITGVITANYDTTVAAPLETLATHMLAALPVEYTQDYVDYVALTFKMYQFTRIGDSNTVTAAEGYDKLIPYNDQFFATRVWSVDSSGNETELAYCFESMVYDPDTPTAIISVRNDVNEMRLQIPQVYFTTGMMGSKIRYEILTTKGAINYTIPISDAINVKANFDTTSSVYAAPLAKMSIYSLYATGATVVGGSDSLTFAEIKDGIVNQKFYTRIPITPTELEEAAAKNGYKLTRLVDDLTDRIFIATNTLLDDAGAIIPVTFSSILITSTSLSGDPQTILGYGDGTYTILPTTVFEAQPSGTVVLPMTNAQIANMAAMSDTDLAAALNTGNYLRQPFHIVLDTEEISPSARIYNLLSPMMSSLVFIRENINSSPQMSVGTIQIQHNANGTGGYAIRLAIVMSANMKTVDPGSIRITLSTRSKVDSPYYLDATYVQTTSSGMIFEVQLGTSYQIDSDDYLTTLMKNNSGVLSDCAIALSSIFDIYMMVDQSVFPTIAQDSVLTESIDYDISNYLVISHQQATLLLGTNLSNTLYTGVNTSWGNDVYKTYTSNVYATTTTTVFQLNEKGLLETRVATDASGNKYLELVTIYNAGDTPAAEGNISTTVSVEAAAGANNLTLEDATGVLKGMTIICAGVPYGATVSNVDGQVITLSAPPTVTVTEGTAIAFSNSKVLTRTTSAQTAASATVSVASSANMYVGESVFGFDIQSGTTIAEIPSDTSIVLSTVPNAPLANNALLTVINTTAHGVLKYAAGTVQTNAAGTPIIINDRQNQYRIPSILFDGRLYNSSGVTDIATQSEIPQKIVDYAAGIANINMGLAEQQDIYYRPARTIGNATFGVGNNITASLPLGMSFNITLSVPQAVYADTVVRTSLSNSVIGIVVDQVQQPIISSTAIANAIQTSLAQSVDGVSVSGVNNDPDLMIIALKDTDAVPSVEQLLEIQTDGTMARKPNINITFIASPEGT